MGDTKKDCDKFSGLTLHKYYRTEDDDIDTMEIQVRRRSNDSTCGVLITGIHNEFGKSYTQSLLFSGTIHCTSPLATVNSNVDMVLEDDEEFGKDYVVAVACKVHKYQ